MGGSPSATRPAIRCSSPRWAGKVAGWGSLAPWSPRPAYARTAEESVYVAAGCRGAGIGVALLAALVDRARDAGLGVLIARVADASPASMALHRSLRFRRIGTQRRCGEKHGRIIDVELLDLQLDER